jgi:hypothetical protein
MTWVSSRSSASHGARQQLVVGVGALDPAGSCARPGGPAAIMLQRWTLLTQDGSARPGTAWAVLLSPGVSPWYFHQEEVPRAGLRI